MMFSVFMTHQMQFRLHLCEVEEMALCARDPLLVNAFLLRPSWGSGRLVRCTSDGEAVFKRGVS